MRYWSREKFNEMLWCWGGYLDGVPKGGMTDDEHTDIGDYLYYQLHPEEKDSRKDRPVPKYLRKRTACVYP